MIDDYLKFIQSIWQVTFFIFYYDQNTIKYTKFCILNL
jgi:hypothetical protein